MCNCSSFSENCVTHAHTHMVQIIISRRRAGWEIINGSPSRIMGNFKVFCLCIDDLKKKTCCSHCDQKYNEELSTIVCRQRVLRKRGHVQTRGHLLTRIFLLKILVGRCVLLHKTKPSTCEDKVRLFYAIKTDFCKICVQFL